jgi:hypothetical protein
VLNRNTLTKPTQLRIPHSIKVEWRPEKREEEKWKMKLNSLHLNWKKRMKKCHFLLKGVCHYQSKTPSCDQEPESDCSANWRTPRFVIQQIIFTLFLSCKLQKKIFKWITQLFGIQICARCFKGHRNVFLCCWKPKFWFKTSRIKYLM